MKISQKVCKMGDIARNVEQKTENLMLLLIFLVTAKKQLEIGSWNFFNKMLSKFPFETYIVLNKKYKMW